MGKEGYRPTLRERAKTALQAVGDSLRSPQSQPHPKDQLKLIASQRVHNPFDAYDSRIAIPTRRSSAAKLIVQNKAP